MKAQDLIEALQIIESARPETESPYHIRVEHDTIWAGGAEYALNDEQQKRLEELGAEWNGEVDGWEMRM